jgi:hypothetical protein
VEALAQAGSDTPREDASEIVRAFRNEASDTDQRELRKGIETELAWRRNREVATAYLAKHSLRLAILEGALKGAEGYRRASCKSLYQNVDELDQKLNRQTLSNNICLKKSY